jgi:hypothetical protein
MSSLDAFLDSGTLPFSGRERELGRIVAFWRAALRGDGLRILLIEGEAGVGKSRLVQEAVERIAGERGTAVHAKLYAELTTAIAPLLDEALARTDMGRQLGRNADGGSLGAAAEAMRRIGRLRPTVLVIEDIQLLAGAPVRELVQLFEAIEDEPIAVVLTARTQEYPSRRVLERWPLEEMSLPVLEREDLGAVLAALFDDRADASMLDALATASLGNPLALRSALRGAIRREALRRDDAGAWHAEASFASVAARSASSLVEGMLAAASDEDRRLAGALAALGEVFSREAAAMLVDDDVIERLSGAGLLHELPTAKAPLPMLRRSASLPLAFTHSLVHRTLTAESESSVADLLPLVAEALPLYAIGPFATIATIDRLDDAIDLALVRRAIDVALNVALGLDKTSDWALAITAHRAAERLFELSAERWSASDRRERSIAITARRLALLRREMTSESFGRALDRLGELVAGEIPAELGWYRLAHAIAEARRRYLIEGYAAGAAIFDRIDAIVARQPELGRHQQYVLVLQTFAQFASENDDDAMRRRVESEYERLMAVGDLPEDHRILAQTQVPPYLLSFFSDEKELAHREAMYADLKELERHPAPMARMIVHAMLPSEPKYLLKTGRIYELIALIDERLEMVRSQGMMVVHATFRLYRLVAEALLGLDVAELIGRVRALATEHGVRAGEPRDGFGEDARLVVLAALVRGEDDLARSLAAEYAIDTASPAEESASGVEEHLAGLAHRIVAIGDIVALRAHLRALEHATLDNRGENRARSALERALAWLAERRLDWLMRSLLDAFGDRLRAKDVATWRKRAAAITAERDAGRVAASDDARLRITMLGRIEVRRPDAAEAAAVRGARQKSFLGAMVGRELTGRPLGRDEFLEAAGIEQGDDPKLARDAVNSAIYRLRDVIGHDAIITDAETPRLNMARVSVDLVDAFGLLREATRALKRGALALAAQSALEALEITRGEVPFPALYETFFETLREDFEIRLRETVLAVAQRLVAESDHAGAARLLERAVAFTPDDEEIAEHFERARP